MPIRSIYPWKLNPWITTKGPLNKFRGPVAQGCAAIFQRPQVVGKWSKSKITLFDLRGLRSPGRTYSDFPISQARNAE